MSRIETFSELFCMRIIANEMQPADDLYYRVTQLLREVCANVHQLSYLFIHIFIICFIYLFIC